MINASAPLLELFAVVDAVFSENDSMDPANRQVGMGRMYEQWKRTRAQLDPDWNPRDTERQRMGRPWKRRGARQEDENRARAARIDLGASGGPGSVFEPFWRGYSEL